jgi:hypothetical protein
MSVWFLITPNTRRKLPVSLDHAGISDETDVVGLSFKQKEKM